MLGELVKARVDFLRAQSLERGDGVAVDLAKAVRLYRRAAFRGLADAQHALGFLYAVGHGVPRNEAMGVAWFVAAAEQEHAAAQHNLGVMCAEGRGTPQDEERAVFWFYRAALNGNQLSRDWIAANRDLLPAEIVTQS